VVSKACSAYLFHLTLIIVVNYTGAFDFCSAMIDLLLSELIFGSWH